MLFAFKFNLFLHCNFLLFLLFFGLLSSLLSLLFLTFSKNLFHLRIPKKQKKKKRKTTSSEDKVFCATANDCRVTIANIHRLDLLVTEHPHRIMSTTTVSRGERRRKKSQIICELVSQVFHFYTNRARTRNKQRNLPREKD